MKLDRMNCQLCYHVYYEEYLSIYYLYDMKDNEGNIKKVYSLIYLDEKRLDGEDEEPMKVIKVGSLEECLKALREDELFIDAIENELFDCEIDNLKEEDMKMFLEWGL